MNIKVEQDAAIESDKRGGREPKAVAVSGCRIAVVIGSKVRWSTSAGPGLPTQQGAMDMPPGQFLALDFSCGLAILMRNAGLLRCWVAGNDGRWNVGPTLDISK